MSSQNVLIFLTRPISAALLALSALLLILFVRGEWTKRRRVVALDAIQGGRR